MQSDLELISTSTHEAKEKEVHLELPVRRDVSLLYPYWHRAMDIVYGLLSLAFLLLILPILALLIYLDSPGPIFYSQERVGYLGRKFYMHKLRSMYVDAEDAGEALRATRYDERMTRIGRFLRVTHLDELPQTFNILRGEMSLIGPRPEREHFVAKLEKADPLYCRRLTVKPGLTGWAQVEYGYASTRQQDLTKLQYDLYYIEHQSFTLDIRILLKTVVEVVLCHGT